MFRNACDGSVRDERPVVVISQRFEYNGNGKARKGSVKCQAGEKANRSMEDGARRKRWFNGHLALSTYRTAPSSQSKHSTHSRWSLPYISTLTGKSTQASSSKGRDAEASHLQREDDYCSGDETVRMWKSEGRKSELDERRCCCRQGSDELGPFRSVLALCILIGWWTWMKPQQGRHVKHFQMRLSRIASSPRLPLRRFPRILAIKV